jgi:putative hemolysin
MSSEKDSSPVQKIDIRKIFHDKNPRVARVLPGFVYRYIERIVHQDFVNAFLEKHGHEEGLAFVRASIQDFNIKFIIKGEENLPQGGKYIFASNHPLGGFDGLLLLEILSHHYANLKFMVNDLLMNIKNLRPLFIPINKHGSQARDAAKTIDDAFQSDAQILTFPSGLVSRKIKGEIRDLEWKKNFVIKARKYKRDIVPIYISGRNTPFFYRFAKLRKMIGIKTNIEMFYLMDETCKHQGKTITIVFGKPVSHEQLDTTRSPAEWATRFREHVYRLKDDHEIDFMGQL